jgi:hypothetical protein
MIKIFPKPETLPTSLIVSIIIYGSALVILACFTGAIWLAITLFANVAHNILFRITKLPIPTISNTVQSIIEKFPASISAVLISIAYSSCGGIALILACIVYFILVSFTKSLNL